MSAFKIGDQVVLVDDGNFCVSLRYLIGLETTVVEIGPKRFCGHKYDYLVDTRGQTHLGEIWVFESTLRPLRPPPFEAGDWELCPWRPPAEAPRVVRSEPGKSLAWEFWHSYFSRRPKEG